MPNGLKWLYIFSQNFLTASLVTDMFECKCLNSGGERGI